MSGPGEGLGNGKAGKALSWLFPAFAASAIAGALPAALQPLCALAVAVLLWLGYSKLVLRLGLAGSKGRLVAFAISSSVLALSPMSPPAFWGFALFALYWVRLWK